MAKRKTAEVENEMADRPGVNEMADRPEENEMAKPKMAKRKRAEMENEAADEPEVVLLTDEVTYVISKMRSIQREEVKDAFLWELLRNAAHAVTKIRLESLVDEKIYGPEPEQFIHIVPDQKNGSLSIIDNGIGMNTDDLKSYLADHSERPWVFSITANLFASDPDADISCLYLQDFQFSLGFHSAYMVADKVVVTTKTSGDDQYVWESNGIDSCTIARDTSGERLGRGTKVTLFLNDNHLKYADEHILNNLIKKYVELLTYPIHVLVDDGKTKKQIVDDEKPKALPIETLRVKFEGLRKKFEKYIGHRVEKIVVSDRIFDLPNNLSRDGTTFEINPRSPIMEELRQMADDKDFDEEEMRLLILAELQGCIFNIRAFDMRHGTSYGKMINNAFPNV